MRDEFSDLTPEVAERARVLLSVLARYGVPARLTNTRRSSMDQFKLYLRGRLTQGPIVTRALPGRSLHEYGRAFDITFLGPGYHAPARWWSFAGAVGRSLGLRWGRNWKAIRDKPHFQR